jgi:hypothetical protein
MRIIDKSTTTLVLGSRLGAGLRLLGLAHWTLAVAIVTNSIAIEGTPDGFGTILAALAGLAGILSLLTPDTRWFFDAVSGQVTRRRRQLLVLQFTQRYPVAGIRDVVIREYVDDDTPTLALDLLIGQRQVNIANQANPSYRIRAEYNLLGQEIRQFLVRAEAYRREWDEMPHQRGLALSLASRLGTLGAMLAVLVLLSLLGVGLGAAAVLVKHVAGYRWDILFPYLGLGGVVMLGGIWLLALLLAAPDSPARRLAFVLPVLLFGAGVCLSHDVLQDALTGPAVTQGPVTDRTMNTQVETDSDDDTTTITTYTLTVGGQQFSAGIGGDGYARARKGSCIQITYGPRTDIVTAVTRCRAAP